MFEGIARFEHYIMFRVSQIITLHLIHIIFIYQLKMKRNYQSMRW